MDRCRMIWREISRVVVTSTLADTCSKGLQWASRCRYCSSLDDVSQRSRLSGLDTRATYAMKPSQSGQPSTSGWVMAITRAVVIAPSVFRYSWCEAQSSKAAAHMGLSPQTLPTQANRYLLGHPICASHPLLI